MNKIKLSIFASAVCAALILSGCSSGNGEKKPDETAVSGETGNADEAFANPEKYVTLGQYKGIEVTVAPVEVLDSEIDDEINAFLAENTVKEEITERPAQAGDVVTVDFEGYVDGELSQSATAADVDFKLGESAYVDGFTEAIVGMSLNETKTADLKFPDEYYDGLSGKDVQFKITVKKITKSTVPEFTDEFVASKTFFATADAYKSSLIEALRAKKEEAAYNSKLDDVWAAILTNATFSSLPEAAVQSYVDESVKYYTDFAESNNITLAQLAESSFGYSENEFYTRITEESENSVKNDLLVSAIANAENITVSDEEYASRMADYLKTYEYSSAEEMEAAYGRTSLECSMLRSMVYEFVAANAVETTAE